MWWDSSVAIQKKNPSLISIDKRYSKFVSWLRGKKADTGRGVLKYGDMFMGE